MTREDWLTKAIEHLKPEFQSRAEAEIPNVRVSVGFPGGGSPRKRIGEYWHASAARDGVPQIFISPVLEEGLDALTTLVHELVHAVTPGAKHGAAFKRVAMKVGLLPPMRATPASDELKERLNALIQVIGPYPHGALNLGAGKEKQSTRLIKVQCRDCGYPVRVTRKWIEDAGAPRCPCGGGEMVEA